MKMTIKDKYLQEDLEYNVFEYSYGWRGINSNPFLQAGPPPRPIFNVTLIFLNQPPPKLLVIIRNFQMRGVLIDEVLIETEHVPVVKYEKVIIPTHEYNIDGRNITYKIYFEALRMRIIRSPQEEKEYEVIDLINDGVLYLGLKPNQVIL